MPSLKDPYFHRSVTYLCEHNDQGAMGLVINQPAQMTVNELLKQIDTIEVKPDILSTLEGIVYTGGPVSPERGFVLHTPQRGWSSSMKLSDSLMVTTSRDILESLGTLEAPDNYLVTLGYAGWSAGQLEDELAQNSWLTVPADDNLIFEVPVEKRWEAALARLGIHSWDISPDIGHA